MRVTIKSGFLEIDEAPPIVLPPEPSFPLIPVEPPVIPPARIPYFDVGEAAGAPGDTVEVPVEAGCIHPIDGFHIGGGVGLHPDVERSGYGKFRAIGAVLGPFLSRYLKAEDGKLHENPEDVGDHYFSKFAFASWENRALPEEWWEFFVGFFSLEDGNLIPPIPIPSGTLLFTLKIKILPATVAGVYDLTCLDEHYYTNSHQRRRDFTYTYKPQGFTAIETFGGKITVT